MTDRKLLGYWRNAEHPELPDANALVDNTWDVEEREAVAGYLGNGLVAMSFMGYSECRICGNQNGDLEFTDGAYQWPSGLAHYVEVHAVRLPDEFVTHVHEMLDQLDRARPRSTGG